MCIVLKVRKKHNYFVIFFLEMNIKTAFDRVLDKRRKMFKKEQKMIKKFTIVSETLNYLGKNDSIK